MHDVAYVSLACLSSASSAVKVIESQLILQEYTMMDGEQVYGWPKNGYPAPQGPFYCGVGDESTYGRPLAEDHLDACVESNLTISGINAEVCATFQRHQHRFC